MSRKLGTCNGVDIAPSSMNIDRLERGGFFHSQRTHLTGALSSAEEGMCQEVCYEAGVQMGKPWVGRACYYSGGVSMSPTCCEPRARPVGGRRLPLMEMLLKSRNPPAP